MTTEELLKLTVETLDRKKGMDIKALKVTDLTVIADYFVIVTGTRTILRTSSPKRAKTQRALRVRLRAGYFLITARL